MLPPYCPSAPPARTTCEQTLQLNGLQGWAAAGGATGAAAAMYMGPQHGAGIIATQDLQEGNVVLSVPDALTLDAAAASGLDVPAILAGESTEDTRFYGRVTRYPLRPSSPAPRPVH